MATVAGVKIKTKSKKITSQSIREHAKKDHSPRWDGCETWSESQFLRHFHAAMQYYRLESSGKELKVKVIDWMGRNGYDKATISAFKKTKDNRCGTTVGAVAACLIRGMQSCRPDFNKGRDTATWLGAEIAKVIAEGKDDIDDEAVAEVKSTVPVISIQDRVRDASYAMTLEIEDAIEAFSNDPDSFDPKAFKVLNLLKGHQAKAAHARIIKGFYERNLNELVEAATSKDEQVKEAYSHLSKANLKKITAFYQEVVSACDMLAAEAKVNRAPRKTKAVSKDKLIAKLKYMKSNEPLKLVSVNPVDIIGAKELWVYNNKTRKLGKYVADEYKELAVKGTTILNFSESQSVQKTLRKPVEQLKAFKDAGKVALRKFLEDINAVDTKLNGRVNEDILLLKVA
jgi:hypothetical protein